MWKPGLQSSDPQAARPLARSGQVDDHERRIRRLEQPRIPILPDFVKADLPPAAASRYGMIFVKDEIGGAVPAFSDGTNWLRVTDRAIVS